MGEPEPERRRQTKQKLRRPQGAGIWPEAVPRTEGQIRIMTFLDAPLQVSSEQTTTMINRKNRLTDLALTGESFETRADADPYFTKSQAAALIRPYLNATDPKNPLVSPLYADLTGLPPIRIHVGDDEVLLDDSRRYLERALAAGVDAELDIWMGMPHGFVTNVNGFNAAAQALKASGAFLTERLGSTAR